MAAFWQRWFDRKSNVSMSSVDLLREMLGANRSQSGVVVACRLRITRSNRSVENGFKM
jgi:hypothetical protein